MTGRQRSAPRVRPGTAQNLGVALKNPTSKDKEKKAAKAGEKQTSGTAASGSATNNGSTSSTKKNAAEDGKRKNKRRGPAKGTTNNTGDGDEGDSDKAEANDELDHAAADAVLNSAAQKYIAENTIGYKLIANDQPCIVGYFEPRTIDQDQVNKLADAVYINPLRAEHPTVFFIEEGSLEGDPPVINKALCVLDDKKTHVARFRETHQPTRGSGSHRFAANAAVILRYEKAIASLQETINRGVRVEESKQALKALEGLLAEAHYWIALLLPMAKFTPKLRMENPHIERAALILTANTKTHAWIGRPREKIRNLFRYFSGVENPTSPAVSRYVEQDLQVDDRSQRDTLVILCTNPYATHFMRPASYMSYCSPFFDWRTMKENWTQKPGASIGFTILTTALKARLAMVPHELRLSPQMHWSSTGVAERIITEALDNALKRVARNFAPGQWSFKIGSPQFENYITDIEASLSEGYKEQGMPVQPLHNQLIDLAKLMRGFLQQYASPHAMVTPFFTMKLVEYVQDLVGKIGYVSCLAELLVEPMLLLRGSISSAIFSRRNAEPTIGFLRIFEKSSSVISLEVRGDADKYGLLGSYLVGFAVNIMAPVNDFVKTRFSALWSSPHPYRAKDAVPKVEIQGLDATAFVTLLKGMKGPGLLQDTLESTATPISWMFVQKYQNLPYIQLMVHQFLAPGKARAADILKIFSGLRIVQDQLQPRVIHYLVHPPFRAFISALRTWDLGPQLRFQISLTIDIDDVDKAFEARASDDVLSHLGEPLDGADDEPGGWAPYTKCATDVIKVFDRYATIFSKEQRPLAIKAVEECVRALGTIYERGAFDPKDVPEPPDLNTFAIDEDSYKDLEQIPVLRMRGKEDTGGDDDREAPDAEVESGGPTLGGTTSPSTATSNFVEDDSGSILDDEKKDHSTQVLDDAAGGGPGRGGATPSAATNETDVEDVDPHADDGEPEVSAGPDSTILGFPAATDLRMELAPPPFDGRLSSVELPAGLMNLIDIESEVLTNYPGVGLCLTPPTYQWLNFDQPSEEATEAVQQKLKLKVDSTTKALLQDGIASQGLPSAGSSGGKGQLKRPRSSSIQVTPSSPENRKKQKPDGAPRRSGVTTVPASLGILLARPEEGT